MIRISILGATGSIGLNTIDVIKRNPGRFRVMAVTAHKNAAALAEIARAAKAEFAVIADASQADALKDRLDGTEIKIAAGAPALVEAADYPADVIMAAISGIAGLPAVLAAARHKVKLAIANKEAIICAGPLLMARAKKSGCQILPVDSEHHALYHMIDDPADVALATLTASGGPFRDCPLAHLADVTVREAVNHPVWKMGAKISVDSATLMNKALELIEAHYLFALRPDQLAMIIHRQSIVHALVTSHDGSVRAHMGLADMRAAIADVLGACDSGVLPLNIARLAELTFEPVDEARFPASKLAQTALQYGGGAPIILNAANEAAVAGFLNERIGFTDIVDIVSDVLETAIRTPHIAPDNLADILEMDQMARRHAENIIKRKKSK